MLLASGCSEPETASTVLNQQPDLSSCVNPVPKVLLDLVPSRAADRGRGRETGAQRVAGVARRHALGCLFRVALRQGAGLYGTLHDARHGMVRKSSHSDIAVPINRPKGWALV